MGDREFYWDWLKHEAEILTSRGNLFLVAESMLVAAHATMAVVSQPQRDVPLWAVCTAGLFVTCIWLLVNLKHVCITIPSIQEALRKVEPRWDKIAQKRRNWPSNARLLGIVMPLGLLLLWAILFGLTLCKA